MPYKTVSIKLLKPTAAKKAHLDNAINRYSTAFEILLRGISGKIADEKPSKASIIKLLDKESFAEVSDLNVEPFKDALKLDLAKLISIYTAKKAIGHKTSYPITRTEDANISSFIDDTDGFSKRQTDSLFNKFQKKVIYN